MPRRRAINSPRLRQSLPASGHRVARLLKTILILALAAPLTLTLGGCIAAPGTTRPERWPETYSPPPLGLERASRAQQQLDDCLKRAARRLDDGKSPVSTAAQTVAAQCQGQATAAAAAGTQGLSSDMAAAGMAQAGASALGRATQVVREERRGKGKDKSQPGAPSLPFSKQ